MTVNGIAIYCTGFREVEAGTDRNGKTFSGYKVLHFLVDGEPETRKWYVKPETSEKTILLLRRAGFLEEFTIDAEVRANGALEITRFHEADTGN